MLLSARMLNAVADVNTFDVVATFEMTQGDNPTIYFQTIDASVLKFSEPLGRRYCPPTGSTLRVILKDINTDQTITVQAKQPFSGDKSIWSFKWPVATSTFDPAQTTGTFALKLSLVEPGNPATVPANWDISTTYGLNAFVSFGGVYYYSLQDTNFSNQPDTSPTFWQVLNFTPPRTLVGFLTQAINVSLAQQEF